MNPYLESMQDLLELADLAESRGDEKQADALRIAASLLQKEKFICRSMFNGAIRSTAQSHEQMVLHLGEIAAMFERQAMSTSTVAEEFAAVSGRMKDREQAANRAFAGAGLG